MILFSQESLSATSKITKAFWGMLSTLAAKPGLRRCHTAPGQPSWAVWSGRPYNLSRTLGLGLLPHRPGFTHSDHQAHCCP